MRHKVRAAGKKNKEGEVERGGNLPLLGSTHAVFLFTSFCAVPRNWTPGTGLHGSVDLGNDYLTNRFHVAVRGAQVQQFQMKFCDLLVNRPRVTWNLYVLHNEQKRNNDIIASYRFTVRGFVLDFQVVKNLSRFILFCFFPIYKHLAVSHL